MFSGTIYFRRLSIWYKLIYFQMILAAVCETYGSYLARQYKHNAWVFNAYYLPELVLIALAGSGLAFKKINKIVLVFLLLGLAVWGLNLHYKGIMITANWAVLYNSLLIVILFIVVLYNASFNNQSTLIRHPDLWLSIGIILYFALNLPLFGMLNYLVNENMKLAEQLFLISDVTGVIRYLLIGVGFYLLGRQAKPVKHNT
jgi:hypothetical protein